MMRVLRVAFVIILSSFPGFVWAEEQLVSVDRRLDLTLDLTVGEQQIIRGTFDSQLSFSRKGLVNVRWIDEQSFLITALKSGVLIIDPTPLTKRERRWLITIKTPYQAKKDSGHLVDRKFSGYGGSLPSYFDPLKSKRFQSMSRKSRHGDLRIDCYHPDKKEFVYLLRRFHPTSGYVCEDRQYSLDVALYSRHLKDVSNLELQQLLGDGLPHKARDDSKVARYGWRVDVYPAVEAMNFQLKHESTHVEIQDLHYYLSGGKKVLAFKYKLMVDGVEATGHIRKPYALGTEILLTELVTRENQRGRKRDLVYKDIPIVGFLVTVRHRSALRSVWQMHFTLHNKRDIGQEP